MALLTTKQRSEAVHVILQAWRICCLLARCDTLETQLEQARLEKKPMSIWTMKADLQGGARKEFDLRLNQSERLTVLDLREHIGAQGEAEKLTSDPFAKLPVGLSRMTKEQLVPE